MSVMFANVRYCSLMIDFELTVWSKSFKFVQNRTYCSVVNVQSSIILFNDIVYVGILLLALTSCAMQIGHDDARIHGVHSHALVGQFYKK